ncbi:TIGR01621 family pseudouridine synthase [Neptunicella marina]|uniref:TIGR01621 family pseudouridine synthase n=1 Tax=Neptunicella marina TaxID=2125989 RepID=A0A8J6IQ06_9ALTE|nr:TIGR01621 family pseudouridine synthase [Neptunicella marina]MBC3764539.1 TIGR01621 family pseudouridine synthase [Neptunicella marina]
MLTIPIVHEHNDFLIINKPAGIGVHQEGEKSGIIPLLCAQLGVTQLWLVHRLDTLTSGCLLVAKNAEAAATLSNLFKQREVQKYYLAITDKKPKKKMGSVIGDMKKARSAQWMLTSTIENPAISQFMSKGLFDGKRLILIKPHTGKTHQIRVMLKSLSSPILGDELYGGTSADRAYLHAFALKFNYQDQIITSQCEAQSGKLFIQMQQQELLGDFQHPEQLNWPALKLKNTGHQHG